MEQEKKTILTLEHCGDKVTMELPWDVGTGDLVKAFYGIAIASTWDPKTLLEYMKDWSESTLRSFNKE